MIYTRDEIEEMEVLQILTFHILIIYNRNYFFSSLIYRKIKISCISSDLEVNL